MDSQPLEVQNIAPKPKLKPQTKASKPKATSEAASEAVVDEPPKELVLKAKIRDPEQIALYQQLLAQSQLSKTQYILNRCLSTNGGGEEVPIINIQAYHELGQCRLVFEELLEQLKAIADSQEPLTPLIAQMQQELASIRSVRQSLIEVE